MRVSPSALQTTPRTIPALPRRPPWRRGELRTCWRALWTSRLLVLASGVLGVLEFRPASSSGNFDPARLTAPFSYTGNLLVAPLARWDSVWYLAIARHGYGHVPARTAFYPLYPLLIRGVGDVLGSNLLAGVAISLVCFGVGLVALHRLVALELDAEHAELCVLLVAFAPMAFFFSAVYTEALFLALSVACVYAARKGRWAWAGVLGGLAAASRNTGVLLIVPFALLYLYGPRADFPACSLESVRHTRNRVPAGAMRLLAQLAPRYRVRPSLAFMLLVPAGLGAYVLGLALTTGNGLQPFGVENLWYRQFIPLGGLWQGAIAAFDGARQLLHGPPPPTYFATAAGDSLAVAGQNLMLFAFLIGGVVACIGVFRRLPFAYGAYVAIALAAALSYPVAPQPLASLPRYEVVLFPLFMWAATWVRRRGVATLAIAAGAVLLGFFTAEFATWHFVA